MSTQRKKNITPFPLAHSMAPGGLERHFIRLPCTLMNQHFFQKLPHASYKLYSYMCQYGSHKRTFDFSYGTYRHILSKDGFQKAVKELVAVGLIDIVEHNKNLRRPNKYSLSERWKQLHVFVGNDSSVNE